MNNLFLKNINEIILINYSYENLPCELYDYEDRGNIIKGENAEIYYNLYAFCESFYIIY